MRKFSVALMCVVLLAAGAAACVALPGGTGALQLLTATPGTLAPAFTPGEHDYGVICAAGLNDLAIDAVPTDAGSSVSIAGADPNDHVLVQEDQLVTITVTKADTSTERYYVRCLPHDFPDLQVNRPRPFQVPGWYLFNPSISDPNHGTYVVVMDEQGAVVWYKKTDTPTVDLKRLPDGNLLWSPLLGGGGFGADPNGGAEERTLDGTLVHHWQTNGTITDFHDAQPLANGNMLLGSYHERDNVDVTALAPAVSGLWNVLDAWIQEVRPDGTVAWEWHSEDHIGLNETVAQLDGVGITPFTTVDLVHMNSFEIDPNGDLIVSARHTDAIYKIRRNPGHLDDGRILWKLGGDAPTLSVTKHLTLVNDPYNGPARQHDARILPNGNITAFDNRTAKAGQPARGVEYAVDEAAATATMVWQRVSDDGVNACCLGSVRRQADGTTIIGWGGMAPDFTVVDPANVKLFEVAQTGGFWNYRVAHEAVSSFDRETLRSAAGGAVVAQGSAASKGTAFDPTLG